MPPQPQWQASVENTSPGDDQLAVLIGDFRFEYEYEIEYEIDFSILVFRLHVITTYTYFIP